MKKILQHIAHTVSNSKRLTRQNSISLPSPWRGVGGEAFLLLLLLCSALPAWSTQYYVVSDKEVKAKNISNSDSDYGLSWTKPMTLAEALTRATSGDYIFVKGYNEDLATGTTDVNAYFVPMNGTTPGTFTLKAGVQLYGGFAGTEGTTTTSEAGVTTTAITTMSGSNTSVFGSSADPRKFADGKMSRMLYRSVLCGDVNNDDKVLSARLIYPENPTRSDNAKHVVTIDLSTTGHAVLNGFAIFGGNADDETETSDDAHGGGVLVKGNSAGTSGTFNIAQCFLANNYARLGGAIYVSRNVGSSTTTNQNIINLCSMMNNVAATRSSNNNAAAAVYMAGAGTIANSVIYNNVNGALRLSANAKCINNTVCRNSEAAIDIASEDLGSQTLPTVANCVFWGNTDLSTEATLPSITYSAVYYYESDLLKTELGNVPIIDLNISEDSGDKERCVYFENPSTYTTFDRTYDWRTEQYPYWSWALDERSALVDKGSVSAYNNSSTQSPYGILAIGGTNRYSSVSGTTKIDIGACQLEQISSARRLYVTKAGAGKKDGSSWGNAMSDIQEALNQLALNPNQRGEVWVAEGTYEITHNMDNSTSPYSLRLYDGISLYGGFKGDETRKRDREKGVMPWIFTHETIIRGKGYAGMQFNSYSNLWTHLGSESAHVVWMAPLPSDEDGTVGDFTKPTYLDGVTIEGGNTGSTTLKKYNPHEGVGVFMVDNCYLQDCTVRYNKAAKSNNTEARGGGVYSRGGNIKSCLVHNNIADDGRGGGIYVESDGTVSRSQMTNNSAAEGAAVYLNYDETLNANLYSQILSSSVISNNTATKNGAVYVNRGGVVEQCTIANNFGSMSIDETEKEPARTGGLYIKEYAYVINNIIWNNLIKNQAATHDVVSTDASSTAKAQVYVYPTASKNKSVTFYNNAISDKNFTIWNYISQDETITLNSTITSDNDLFEKPNYGTWDVSAAMMNTTRGVQNWTSINYYWRTANATKLQNAGLQYGLFPGDIIDKPDLDPEGNAYDAKPTIGAWVTTRPTIVPAFIATSTSGTQQRGKLRLYLEAGLNNTEGDGSSWANNYQSMNDALLWAEALTTSSSVKAYRPANNDTATISMQNVDSLEFYVRSGKLAPRFLFSNNDAQSATVSVTKTCVPLTLMGGFPEYTSTTGMTDDEINKMRNPVTYRSNIHGNNDGQSLSTGLYHVVRVQEGANLTFDGFVVSHGYAAGTASIPRGGGMLITGSTSSTGVATKVNLKDCIFENNTALYGAAVSVETNSQNVAITMTNCVVNNNTCLGANGDNVMSYALRAKRKAQGVHGSETSSVSDWLINLGESGTNTLHTQHCTFVNNQGICPEVMIEDNTHQAEAKREYTSFSAGNQVYGDAENTEGVELYNTYTQTQLATFGTDAAKNFSNPTMEVGAHVSANTYYGGNADFRPLTSGTQSGTLLINQATYDNTDGSAPTQDIMLNDRDLGGQADMGAYEADLPKSGEIYYVRTDGSDSNDGLSWGKAFATIRKATTTAYNQSKLASTGKKPQVWVAAGTYEQAPVTSSSSSDYTGQNCFLIREGVDVYGAFPKTGNPNMDDRHPFISSSIYYDTNSYKADDYETILQPTSAYRSGGSNAGKARVLGQLDMYNPYIGVPNYTAQTSGGGWWSTTTTYTITTTYSNFSDSTIWNGFTIKNGYFNANEIQSVYSVSKNNQGQATTLNTSSAANRNGGGGATIYKKVTLANCVITDNQTYHSNQGTTTDYRAGGVYTDGGTLVNCYIQNNKLGTTTSYGAAYGGGCYMYSGTAYNCVIAGNTITANYADGAGIFIENAEFYNNTIAYNTATYNSRASGGVCIWNSGGSSKLTMYNCIAVANTGLYGELGTKDIAVNGGIIECYNTISESISSATSGNNKITFESGTCKTSTASNLFVSATSTMSSANFRLKDATAANFGEDKPTVNNRTIDLSTYTDMDFTDRIKDCRVDAGAYEYDNKENIAGETNTTKGTVTFYVTQNGQGTRSGNSIANAACATKLQSILTKAGELYKTDSSKKYIVKAAGYKDNGFVYHANTLADPDDPQSYTYLIPNGVTLMGGYNENGSQTDWDNDERDAYSEYRTVLSAVAQTSDRDVTGYHAVTFGSWPGEDINAWDTTAVVNSAIIDGCWIMDGAATETTGHKSMGGGAIVPKNAHVRNCVVTGCEAIYGGGLYLMPGGIASGCLITENSATDGGGVFAGNGKTESGYANKRAYLVSSTIVKNTATAEGGGMYFEAGAAMFGNDVFWGNEAQSDNNVCGIVDVRYENTDYALTSQYTTTSFYPFNDCFVEAYQMPADTRNTEMTSDGATYFRNAEKTGTADYDWMPRIYSSLVNNGVQTSYQMLWRAKGVSDYDIMGSPRIPTDITVTRLTAGAFAVNQVQPESTQLITRLFVSQKSTSDVPDEKVQEYLGRSFYTPFNSLDAALTYIRTVRSTKVKEAGKTDSTYVATVADHFDILMAAGTYSPSMRRLNAAKDAETQRDARLNSFVIPVNVSLYGGFLGTETISSQGLESVTFSSGKTQTLVPTTDKSNADIASVSYDGSTFSGAITSVVQNIRDKSKAYFEDYNRNDLYEPWELANTTTLTGDVQSDGETKHVYHVLYSTKHMLDTNGGYIDFDKLGTNFQDNVDKDTDGHAVAKDEYRNIRLDGLTIMNGASSEYVNTDTGGNETHDEVGHGAGLYTDGVNYLINRCRFRDNKAVHGGAVFVEDADLTVTNSIFNGNQTVAPSNATSSITVGTGTSAKTITAVKSGSRSAFAQGGAICMTNASNTFYAAHTIFANNEATGGYGGAVAVQNSKVEGGSGTEDTPGEDAKQAKRRANSFTTGVQTDHVNLMNCMVVKNEAGYSPSFAVEGDVKIKATNTVFWGNNPTVNTTTSESESNASQKNTYYCASDLPNYTQYNDASLDGKNHHNVQLGSDNMGANGPRFRNPSAKAGVAGYDMFNKWNPAAISVLTDAGDGLIPYKDGVATSDRNHETTSTDGEHIFGAHEEWWTTYQTNYKDMTNGAVKNAYLNKDDYVVTATDGSYYRYMGSRDSLNKQTDKIIDLGLYEYQFPQGFDTMDAVYIGTEDNGLGDGSNWSNQSSDLYGAIVALAHPKSGTSRNKTIYVRDGKYYFPVAGAYTLNMTYNDETLNQLSDTLTIKGACQGYKNESNQETQDFSKPTQLVQNPSKDTPAALLSITTAGKTVSIQGLQAVNSDGKDGNGFDVTINKGKVGTTQTEQTGTLYIGNCLLTDNTGYGIDVKENQGKLLIYNTLFANNQVAGLRGVKKTTQTTQTTDVHTTVVNATFGRNKVDIVSGSEADFYNTVSWSDSTGVNTVNLGDYYVKPSDTSSTLEDTHQNKAFTVGQQNASATEGPNFTNPDKQDYSLSPSLNLLNQGSNQHYVDQVLKVLHPKEYSTSTTLTADELKTKVSADVDILSKKRLVSDYIDIGAYEYQAVLSPILYVKQDGAQNGDGSSWDSPLTDIQSAIDLAGLYANTTGGDSKLYGYVLVDSKATAEKGVSITLPHTKLYGGFNNQHYSGSLEVTNQNAKDIVSDILGQRKGVLEQGDITGYSQISGLTIDYEGDSNELTSNNVTGKNIEMRSAVDGFLIKGDVTLNAGLLSTSVVEGKVSGTKDNTKKQGWIYNSLVMDTISNVFLARNVTCASFFDNKNSGITVYDSNRQNIDETEKNRYVTTGYWAYQPKDSVEKSGKLIAIDRGSGVGSQSLAYCIELSGHCRDLAGNMRRCPGSKKYDKEGNLEYSGSATREDKVDQGCFEVWNIYTDNVKHNSDKEGHITAEDYPHGKSVIYVHKGRELRIDKNLYTSDNKFTPGFLLLEYHAGLRGNGNTIELDNFAVERDLKKGQADIISLPFDCSTDIDNIDKMNFFYYDGSKRAAKDYTFKTTSSQAWVNDYSRPNFSSGMLLELKEGVDSATVRCKGGKNTYANNKPGSNYTEDATPKTVTLLANNYSEPWDESTSETSKKFTHKEHMGWNLFGSPYLCAMNYKDLEYGRVLYGYDNKRAYETVKTYYTDSSTDSKTDGTAVEGYIPAFDGMFTQTATLNNQGETFSVNTPASDSYTGTAYATSGDIKVTLSRAGVGTDSSRAVLGTDYTDNTEASRGGKKAAKKSETSESSETSDSSESSESSDNLLLTAVSASEARTDYAINEDGVKWQADSVTTPQLYALRDGGRYSLLSAVSIKGEVSVGVSVPEAGSYTFDIPTMVDTEKYETVLLKDSETGTAVDLLEAPYTFETQKAETINGRFTLSFNRMANDRTDKGIQVYATGHRIVVVSGLQDGDLIHIYAASGQMEASKETLQADISIPLTNAGMKIVEVIREGQQVAVKKIALK